MISNTSKYAIRATMYLALFSSEEKRHGIKNISAELDIPAPFLGKILQLLVREDILCSIKGPNGGFCLKRAAIDISILDIIQVIEGTDFFDTCVIRTSSCSSDEPCSLHDKAGPIKKEMKRVYASETIADLVSAFRQGKEKIRI